jgi:hypothetical protein
MNPIVPVFVAAQKRSVLLKFASLKEFISLFTVEV